MASNSGCTEVLVDGAITPNFLRKPSESVMGGSLPQVAYRRQWHCLRSRCVPGRAATTRLTHKGEGAARTRPRSEPLAATVGHARILTPDQERAMLRTGKEHRESLRDGRVIDIGSERVDDVTGHAASRNAAATVAALYDMKADPANRDTLTYEEEGGRSPDHVASFVTGMVIKPDALPAPCAHADNLIRYYRHIRDNDVYVVYAVLPPQAARNPEFYQRQNLPVPTLRVVREEDDGVVISGMKMLATGAVYANEIWIGNVLPLAPDQKKESITCDVPCNAASLTLWSRQPAVAGVTSEFDSPLAWGYDESDSMVLCDNVKVAWEKVFVHDDAVLARDIYIKTPSHCFGNHPSNVRYWSKMRLLLGLCSTVAQAAGADQVPAARETLGKMSAVESTIGGLVHGQINAY